MIKKYKNFNLKLDDNIKDDIICLLVELTDIAAINIHIDGDLLIITISFIDIQTIDNKLIDIFGKLESFLTLFYEYTNYYKIDGNNIQTLNDLYILGKSDDKDDDFGIYSIQVYVKFKTNKN